MSGFTVVESLVRGKSGDPAACEDAVVVTDEFVAVFDGATSKRSPPSQGSPPGRVAVEVLSAALLELPPDAEAAAAVAHLSAAIGRLQWEDPDDAPTATAVVWSARRREIWRVGDSSFLVDGEWHPGEKPLDDVAAAARAALLRALLASGSDVETLRAEDPGREMILPLLRAARFLRNREEGCPLAFASIDGSALQPHLIDTVPVPSGVEIVLASDGYPKLFETLAETERYLADDLAVDPLRIGRHATTKGVRPGDESYDDRSYVRLRT